MVLRHLDLLDPESLDDYLRLGGYLSLEKVLLGMTPEEVIDLATATKATPEPSWTGR